MYRYKREKGGGEEREGYYCASTECANLSSEQRNCVKALSLLVENFQSRPALREAGG